MDEAGPHAGPVFELPYLPEYTPEAMLEEIRRVAALVEHPVLSVHRFDRHSRADGWTVSKRFGGWGKALERAGLSHRYSGRDRRPNHACAKLSDEELLEALRMLARKMDRKALRTEDILKSGSLSATVLRSRFGSVVNAVGKAGLKHISPTRRRTAAECHENLLTLWRHCGRAPRMDELALPPSAMKQGPYLRFHRTWKRALAAFVRRMENDPAVKASIAHRAGAGIESTRHGRSRLRPEDKRKIALGLRFQVLQRDRFRCTACGASPAHDPACKLHVDHAVAFSRGGRTELGNLRTLCSLCNLGKGARAAGEARHERTERNELR